MIDTRISISQQIIFNNTGLEWHKLQYPISEHCSKTVVHCLGKDKFYDTLPPDISTIIDGIKVNIWLKFSTEHLQVEAICVLDESIDEELTENEVDSEQ